MHSQLPAWMPRELTCHVSAAPAVLLSCACVQTKPVQVENLVEALKAAHAAVTQQQAQLQPSSASRSPVHAASVSAAAL